MRLLSALQRPLVRLAIAALPFAAGCHSGMHQLKPDPPDMLERALPAVVTVAVYKTDAIGRIYGYGGRKADTAYSKPLNISDAESAGSGFIVAEQGKPYVVTNAHVIDQLADDAGGLAVFTITGRRVPARVVGADTFYDVAVLEFAAPVPPGEVATLSFSTQEPRIGEQVFAIGNPLGAFPYTVTQGIIGGKNRVRGGVTGKFGYLQSSATTIWGNSGGPLVDASGRVVGINSQIEIVSRPIGTFIQPQLNFALEAGVARRVVADIIAHGRVVRAFAGLIATQEFDPAARLPQVGAPRIAALLPGSPAAAALRGREGYAVTAVNGEKIRNLEELLGELEKVTPGGTVLMTLQKGVEEVSASFVAGELTAARQGLQASFFLKSFASLEAVTSRGDVILRKAAECRDQAKLPPSCGSRARLGIYHPATDTAEDLVQFPPAFTVRATGFMLAANTDDARLWKTTSLAELGMAIRTGALAGTVIFSGALPEEDAAMAMVPTDEKGSLLKALLY